MPLQSPPRGLTAPLDHTDAAPVGFLHVQFPTINLLDSMIPVCPFQLRVFLGSTSSQALVMLQIFFAVIFCWPCPEQCRVLANFTFLPTPLPTFFVQKAAKALPHIPGGLCL